MDYQRGPKNPNDLRSHERPDNVPPRYRRESDADKAMDSLYDDEPERDVARRFERDSYQGRRSPSGPARGRSLIPAGNGNRGASPRKVFKRVLIGIVAVLAIALIGMGVWLNSLNSNMQIDDPALDESLTGYSTPVTPYYILIVGSDQRDDEASRADTIILARIDPLKKQVTLVSIPRDTYVNIDGYGMSKINAAHAYGGAALTVTTVEEFAGVKIAHYVEVDFSGFVDVVDAVGGITVDVPEDTTVDDVTLPSGIQTLDGEQALVFVRCRKTYATGDYQRTANQRAFMVALSSAVMSSPAWKRPAIIASISKCISTDMSANGLLLMMLSLQGIDTGQDMYTAVVPSESQTIDGVSYVVADDASWQTMMKKVDAGEDPNS